MVLTVGCARDLVCEFANLRHYLPTQLESAESGGADERLSGGYRKRNYQFRFRSTGLELLVARACALTQDHGRNWSQVVASPGGMLHGVAGSGEQLRPGEQNGIENQGQRNDMGQCAVASP